MYSLTILEARSLRSRCWQVSPELTLAGLQMATFSCVLIGDGLFSVYEPPWWSYVSLSLSFFFFWPRLVASKILVPLPGMELMTLQWKCEFLITGP